MGQMIEEESKRIGKMKPANRASQVFDAIIELEQKKLKCQFTFLEERVNWRLK